MKSVLCLAAALALATARPELYKESEDFQFSRSSTDEGSKSGFYGAQRGNMGGNYERAHNMDGLAQHQMSGLVRQVEGELGDGSKTRTGSVFTAANSAGTYGSGRYDVSNLQGRNFQEGVNYGDSQSSLSQASNIDSHASSALRSSGYNSQNSRYTGYHGSKNYGHGLQSGNLQTADTVATQDFGAQAEGRNTGYASQSGHSAQSGYSSHSGYNSQSAHDNSNIDAYRSNGYRVPVVPQNRLVYATPVKIVGRPGSRVAIPVGVQTYAVHSGYDQLLYDHSAQTSSETAINSEALSDVLSNSQQHLQANYKPTNNAKHYESAYSYRKQWEKHDTKPEIIEVPIPTDTPIPKNSELYDDAQIIQAANSDYNTNRLQSQSSHSSSLSQDYNSNVQSSSASQMRHQAGAQYQQGSSASGLNTNAYSGAHGASHLDSAADATNILGSADKPKSYHSSYSYHKSWERQGDPYVIKPASGVDAGQTSQRLTASSNKGYQYGSQHHSHQGYAHTADCDENGHIRVARSPQFQYETYKQDERYKSFDEAGNTFRNSWSNLGNFESGDAQRVNKISDEGQQLQNNWNNADYQVQQNQRNWEQSEDEQQQPQQTQKWEKFDERTSQNKWDRVEDLGQQTVNNGWEKAEDLTQQTQNKWDKPEDLGQQTQNKWDKPEESGQQTQNTWDNLDDLGQQSENKWDKVDEFEQKAHRWDRLEDLGQQTQNTWDNLGQQTENKWNQEKSIWDKAEELSQKTEIKWEKGENDGQQTRSRLNNGEDQRPPLRSIWNKLEDAGQQTENKWEPVEDLTQQTQNTWTSDGVNRGHDDFAQDQTNFVASYMPGEKEFPTHKKDAESVETAKANFVGSYIAGETEFAGIPKKAKEKSKKILPLEDTQKPDPQSNQTNSPWVGSGDFRQQLRNPWDAWRVRQQHTVIGQRENHQNSEDSPQLDHNELSEKLFPQNTQPQIPQNSEKFEQSYLATQDVNEEGNSATSNVWGTLEDTDKQDKFPAKVLGEINLRKKTEHIKQMSRTTAHNKIQEQKPSWELMVDQTTPTINIFQTKKKYKLKFKTIKAHKNKKKNKIINNKFKGPDSDWFNNKFQPQSGFASEWNKYMTYSEEPNITNEERNSQEYSHGYLGAGNINDNSYDQQTYHAERDSSHSNSTDVAPKTTTVTNNRNISDTIVTTNGKNKENRTDKRVEILESIFSENENPDENTSEIIMNEPEIKEGPLIKKMQREHLKKELAERLRTAPQIKYEDDDDDEYETKTNRNDLIEDISIFSNKDTNTSRINNSTISYKTIIQYTDRDGKNVSRVISNGISQGVFPVLPQSESFLLNIVNNSTDDENVESKKDETKKEPKIKTTERPVEAKKIWQVDSDDDLTFNAKLDADENSNQISIKDEIAENKHRKTVWGQNLKDFKSMPNYKLPLAENFGLRHDYHEFQSYKLDKPVLAESFKKVKGKLKKGKENFNKKIKVKFEGPKNKISSWFDQQIS